MQHGAQAYLLKQFTSAHDLDNAIQRAVAFVDWIPKEDQERPTASLSLSEDSNH
jgi:DNA-binding NarL/FixJ family response regulator